MPARRRSSSYPTCNEQGEKLRKAFPVIWKAGYKVPLTQFHFVYDIHAEIDLSQPDISLGAITWADGMENPTFRRFMAAYGKSIACHWVVSHISLLNAASGASNKMDQAALNLCALDILTAFPFLNLGEFCVFCARMRSLRYVTRRSDYIFSSDTIMQGLHEFLQERRYELEQYERERKVTSEQDGTMSFQEYLSYAASHKLKRPTHLEAFGRNRHTNDNPPTAPQTAHKRDETAHKR